MPDDTRNQFVGIAVDAMQQVRATTNFRPYAPDVDLVIRIVFDALMARSGGQPVIVHADGQVERAVAFGMSSKGPRFVGEPLDSPVSLPEGDA